jgi:hypothetical protein
MRIIRYRLYMKCGLSIGRFLFVNLDNFQGCGLYTGCGLYSQKYGTWKLRSDLRNSNTLFNHYLVKCGGNLIEQNSTFTSPNYPINYPDDTTCLWKVRVPPDHRLVIQIRNFSTESCCDCLEIFEGNTTKSLSIGKYCGAIDPTYIISESSDLVIKFSSDHRNNFKGFLANYMITQKDQCM